MNDLITLRDYSQRLAMGVLAKLLQHPDSTPEELLIENETIAFSIVEDHLNELYDTQNLFDSKRQRKDIPIADWVVSIVLHQLYAKSEYMTPDVVVLDYKATMKDLQLIRTGKRPLDLPTQPDISNSWDLSDEDFDDDLDFDSPLYWGV